MPGLACLATMAAAAAVEQPAQAPQAGEPDEIVVTGERTPRTLRETPSSVAVMTGDQIEAGAGLDRLDQLLEFIPNVQIGGGSQGPTVRGQDSTGVLQALPGFLGGARPRVTLQVDGRAVSYNEFIFSVAPVWDVDRIEVFRTPQTTTQGRNSIAGAIFVETMDPEFDWETRGRLIGGQSDVRHGSVMLTGPILPDQLAFRFAGDVRFSDTSSTRADPFEGADPNRGNYGMARFKLLARPATLPDARLELTYVHTESKSPQAELIRRPFEDRHDPFPGYGIVKTDVDSVTGVIEYRFSPTLDTKTTFSWGDIFAQRFAREGFGETKNYIQDFSVEGIISWRPEPELQVIGGVHRLASHLDQAIDLSLVLGLGEFRDRQHSLGLFSEASWLMAHKLTLTAGLRYQKDSQDREGAFLNPAAPLMVDYDKSFDAWLPKFSLAYDINDQVRAGILIQRAFNPGGLTLNIATGEPDEFDEETLWSYEAFLRARLPDGRVRLNANLFYTRFRDAQREQVIIFQIPGLPPVGLAEIDNAPRAHSYGLELEGDWKITPLWRLRVGLGLLKTRIDETLDPADPIRGKEFQRSPHLTASAAIDWKPSDALQLSMQLRHHSGYYSDDRNIDAIGIEEATVVDARAAWDVGPVKLFGYARNLFDNFYLIDLSLPPANPLITQAATAGDPREVGIGIEARF